MKRCLKRVLFFSLFCFLTVDVFAAPQTKTNNVHGKKNITTTQKMRKQVVRKSAENNKNKRIGLVVDKKTVNITNVVSKVINKNSPMCVYAEKNDVIALRKALYTKDKTKNEEVDTICKNGESLLLIAVKNGNYITAKFLLDSGANVNIQNDAGVAPLHILARMDSVETDRMLKIILHQKTIDLDLKDLEGYTPLMRAVEFEKISAVKDLVKRGANIDVKNNYGLSAPEMAEKRLNGKKSDEDGAVSQYIIDVLHKREK